MPNGRPGDHPITDIVSHEIPTFSPEIDELIRRIVKLGGTEKVETLCWDKWPNWNQKPNLDELRIELQKIFDQIQPNE